MMAWEIKHIFDGDYGCEELQPGEKAKVSVTLVNEKGETKVLSVEDQWLLDKNLSEGSIWPEQTAFIKYHLSPQKCSPFQGASSACPRQKSTVSKTINGAAINFNISLISLAPFYLPTYILPCERRGNNATSQSMDRT